jgi:glycosyltransferase involved in cell wall biosynthesis
MNVLFVYSGNQSSENSNLVLTQASSLMAHNINVDIFAIKGHGFFGYIQNILPLRKQLKKEKYNIVHAHYGLCGLVALFARNCQTKIIVSFMGNDLLGDHAKNGKSTIFGNLLVSVNQLCAKYYDHIIVKSIEMASKVSFSNLSVIPNGVDLDNFNYIDKSLALNRVAWEKNFKHILFISSPNRAEKNFKLTEDSLKQLNMQEIQLHFLQNVPHGDVKLYFYASDLCILTSFHEGSPNVIKEAMVCNCPIVSTDVGDVSWVIGNTEGCYICSFEPSEIAKSIKRALDFARFKGRTNGRERIIEFGLDSESIAKRVLEVYEKVV